MEKLRKGLEKGEYFEDGGRIFVVDEVLAENRYLAHQVEKPEETDLTVAELKEQLKELGLPTSGNKAELIERLNEAQENEEKQNNGEKPEE